MRVFMIVGVLLTSPNLVGGADEKIDVKKLLGKWDLAKQELVIEFAAKEKITVYATLGGKIEKAEGTYKVDGNKIEVTMSFGGKEEKQTFTVSKMTDEEIVGKDSKGKEGTLKRIKPKQ